MSKGYVAETQAQLMQDLDTVTNLARQWKKKFNPYITDPSQKESHIVHLSVILDQRLIFRLHIQDKIKKSNKGLGLLNFLSRFTTRPVLDKMHKTTTP